MDDSSKENKRGQLEEAIVEALKDYMTFEWKDKGTTVKYAKSCLNEYVGDWVNFAGEQIFGEAVWRSTGYWGKVLLEDDTYNNAGAFDSELEPKDDIKE